MVNRLARMSFIMYNSAEEIREIILDEIVKLKDTWILSEFSNRYFFTTVGRDLEGYYIFSDIQGYHFIYSERGQDTTHYITGNIFEIIYWVISSLTSSLAINCMSEETGEISNQRKYILDKQLELLSIIGGNIRKAGEIEISESLKNNPLE